MITYTTPIGYELLEQKIEEMERGSKPRSSVFESDGKLVDSENADALLTMEVTARQISDEDIKKLSQARSALGSLRVIEVPEHKPLNEVQLGAYIWLEDLCERPSSPDRFREFLMSGVMGVNSPVPMLGTIDYRGFPSVLGQQLLKGGVKEGDEINFKVGENNPTCTYRVGEIGWGETFWGLKLTIADAKKLRGQFQSAARIKGKEVKNRVMGYAVADRDELISDLVDYQRENQLLYRQTLKEFGIGGTVISKYISADTAGRAEIMSEMPAHLRHYLRIGTLLHFEIPELKRL